MDHSLLYFTYNAELKGAPPTDQEVSIHGKDESFKCNHKAGDKYWYVSRVRSSWLLSARLSFDMPKALLAAIFKILSGTAVPIVVRNAKFNGSVVAMFDIEFSSVEAPARHCAADIVLQLRSSLD